jgi:type II secretory ATPase GspE/PulE/Tfp pilus assembly ATPase PilB-like protein
VRYRIDGVLRARVELPRARHRMVVSRVKIMAQLDISERRLPQDGRVRMKIGEKPLDLRISTMPVSHGEKVVIRILGGTVVKDSIEGLGMRARDLDRMRKAVGTTNGLVLVTGPTGSGKTTTLYTILRQLNDPAVNVITVEDPVEFELKGIAQLQVKSQIGLTFASALRAFLRQDPDIIMVGEIRDAETAEIAVKSALTGHLVLSTVHTNDSIWTVARLIDMGVPPFLVAASVRCIVAQRLVRRLCQHCKVPASEADYEAFERVTNGRKATSLFGARGCGACAGIGFKGRLAVFEVFSIERDDVKRIVTEGASRDALMLAARADGMKTLVERAIEHVEDGVTTLGEAWACCGM